jgi:hypothetical protein
MKALPAACPKCDRMFELANFVEKHESVDGKNTNFIICLCGYIARHS